MPARIGRRSCMPTARSRVAGSPVISALRPALLRDVGGFQHLGAFNVARQDGDLDGLDRGAGEAQLGRHGIVVVVDLEGDIETAAARVIAGRDRLQRAGVGGIEPHVCDATVEGDADVRGLAEAEAALERGGDRVFQVLAGERSGEPGDRHLLDVAGHHADHLFSAQHSRAPGRPAARRWCRDRASGRPGSAQPSRHCRSDRRPAPRRR